MVFNRYVGWPRRDYRTEECVACGLSWVVEQQRVVPKAGYICPHCYGNKGRTKNGEKNGR